MLGRLGDHGVKTYLVDAALYALIGLGLIAFGLLAIAGAPLLPLVWEKPQRAKGLGLDFRRAN